MKRKRRDSIPQPIPFDRPAQRWSRRPLPPYRHLPGITPHPVLHPEGHLFGCPEEKIEPFDPDRWRDSEDYLYGIDLFNLAYFWEAHEAWEGIWKSVPRERRPGLFLRGLIQVAAGLLKRHMGRAQGARALYRRGADKLLQSAGRQQTYCGIEVTEFAARLERIFADESLRGWPTDPRIRLRVGQSDPHGD